MEHDSNATSERDETGVDRNVVETIEALGSRQRLEILIALADRKYAAESETAAMTFTELYDAVDCGSTSQFSYHLDRLVGTFIVETSDGYQLTYAGDKVQRAIFSGLYESPEPLRPLDIEGTCPICGTQRLDARSKNDQFVIQCRSCETPVVFDLFPRSIARDRSPREIVNSFGYDIWAKYVYVRGSICPECYGKVDTGVELPGAGGRPFAVSVNECRECRFTVHVPVDLIVAFHPVVIEAFWQHGVSILDTSLWQLFEYITTDVWDLTVISEDPFGARVTITLDDVTLRLSIDEHLSVTLVEKHE